MQIITDQNNIYHQTNNSNITKEYFQSAKFHMNVLEIQTTGFTMCKHNFNMNVFRHGTRAALASPLEGPGYFIRQIPFVFRNTHLTNCTEHGHPCSPPDAFCIRATYRQAPPQIPPCLLEVFRMNPLLISSRSPIHTPQAKVQGSQKPPASLTVHLGTATGRTAYMTLPAIYQLAGARCKSGHYYTTHFIKSSSKSSNLLREFGQSS